SLPAAASARLSGLLLLREEAGGDDPGQHLVARAPVDRREVIHADQLFLCEQRDDGVLAHGVPPSPPSVAASKAGGWATRRGPDAVCSGRGVGRPPLRSSAAESCSCKASTSARASRSRSVAVPSNGIASSARRSATRARISAAARSSRLRSI